MIQNNHEIRQNLVARSKTTTGPRRALANIQNTHHAKSVTFDGSAVKPLSKGSQLKGTTITPANKRIKKVGEKASTSKQKGIATPFKIFDDSVKEEKKQLLGQSSTKSKKRIDIYQDEIEYMPPCTDKDLELKMPDYLQKVCNHKPTYNITLPTIFVSDAELKKWNEQIQKEALENSEKLLTQHTLTCEKDEEDLDEFIRESFSKLDVISDEDLFAQLESDESFSLEALDREIREAGLDVPDW